MLNLLQSALGEARGHRELGGGEGLEWTSFVTSFVTGHARRGWRVIVSWERSDHSGVSEGLVSGGSGIRWARFQIGFVSDKFAI